MFPRVSKRRERRVYQTLKMPGECQNGKFASKYLRFPIRMYSIPLIKHLRAVSRGDGLKSHEGALKQKYVVLICLFLFVAAVDTIPDPPAVNPPRSHSCTIFTPHVGGPATLLETHWDAAVGASWRDFANWFSFLLSLENRPVRLRPLPAVFRAADSSPPFVS